jgi:hypothetical protein
MRKILGSTFAAAAASLFLCAMPAWAGHGHGHGHHFDYAWGHHKSSGSATHGSSSNRGENALTDVGSGGGPAPEASDHPGSNKGGALRGLDRANDVAGEHGGRGRTNAGNHGHH